MLISLVSAKGAPGVTVSTLALTLAWPRPALAVEADPRGSEVVVGYAHTHAGAGRDLLAVHMAASRGGAMDQAVRDRVLEIADQRWLLLGLPEPQQAAALDWPRFARACATMTDVDVIADCGALTSAGAPTTMWATADIVLLVVRATARGVRAAQLALPKLRDDLSRLGLGDDRLGLLIVGAGRPYGSSEIGKALTPSSATPVLVDMPWDARVAEFLSSGVKAPGTKVFAGSRFARATREVAAKVIAHAEAMRTATPPVSVRGPVPAVIGEQA